MVKISVAVMAHPSRRASAMALASELGQYPFSDQTIIWDKHNEEWHTGERAMRWGANRADWHIVIQDDAVLTPNFYNNIVNIVTAVPMKTVVSLYVGKVRPLPERVLDAMNKAPDGSWLQHYMLMWGVGILLPSDHIEPMLDYIDEPKYKETAYDIRIGMFYHSNRLPIYYAVPSLVDHDDSIGSLIGNGYDKSPRVAHRLAQGLIDWTSTVVTYI